MGLVTKEPTTPAPGTRTGVASRPGRFAIIEQFLADGVTHMFGNPGTVEQGFLDALGAYPDFHYILGLQETIPVAMADAYARARRRPAVVQLHAGVGLGNGIGMLYQAMRGHAPLVVVNAEAGVRYEAMDAQMAADLVGMAKPVTKYATRVTDPESVLRVLRRAIKIAATPPMGPVYVDLPADVLDAPNTEVVRPTGIPSTRVAPAEADLDAAVAALTRASNPLLIVGDGIATSGAQAELARVAELLGAPVWGADSSEVNLPFDHPLWQGLLGHMFGANSAGVTKQHDTILIVGTYIFPEVFPYLDPAQIFQPDTTLIHVDLDAYEIGKNFTVDLGMVADPKLTLGRLATALEQRLPAEAVQAARQRTSDSGAAKHQADLVARAADEAERDETPLQASAFFAELAAQAPDDLVIFDEGLTTSAEPLPRYLPPTLPGHYFLTRGGSLGVGVPGALGLQLANPGKTVIGFAGDGGAMYTIQALWTAAHHRIPAKIVICNNQSYMLLKLNLEHYWTDLGIEPGAFPASFDLGDPVIDFAKLSESLGVPAARVEHPDQIAPAISRMLRHDGAFLIDLVVSSNLPDATAGK